MSLHCGFLFLDFLERKFLSILVISNSFFMVVEYTMIDKRLTQLSSDFTKKKKKIAGELYFSRARYILLLHDYLL